MNVGLSLEREAGDEGGDEQEGKHGEQFLGRSFENLPSHPAVDGMMSERRC